MPLILPTAICSLCKEEKILMFFSVRKGKLKSSKCKKCISKTKKPSELDILATRVPPGLWAGRIWPNR